MKWINQWTAIFKVFHTQCLLLTKLPICQGGCVVKIIVLCHPIWELKVNHHHILTYCVVSFMTSNMKILLDNKFIFLTRQIYTSQVFWHFFCGLQYSLFKVISGKYHFVSNQNRSDILGKGCSEKQSMLLMQ